MTGQEMRIERDAFGEVEVPAGRYWGAQTQRALALFEIGEERFPSALIRAFGLQKLAAARATNTWAPCPPRWRIPSRRRPVRSGRGVSTPTSP